MHGNGLLVLLRHGKSSFNEEVRFSGWADCPLAPEGIRQAHDAGRMLRDAGIGCDACYTSVLSRAIDTASIVLEELGLADLPVTRSWRLNERHYGILEGVAKKDGIARYGADQVEAWRNAPDAAPPPLNDNDARHPCRKAAYRNVVPELLPATECLRDAFRRVIDFFEAEIRPLVESGRRVLVVTHANPVRALVAHLEGYPAGEIPVIEIGNASPVVYAPDRTGMIVHVPAAYGFLPLHWLGHRKEETQEPQRNALPRHLWGSVPLGLCVEVLREQRGLPVP